ncbi:MAG: hypothetical protein H6Q90_4389 [Deltaproteobacteria bacterium]|nr:hypothetical protein [Deltaproteobacteria bacterium]
MSTHRLTSTAALVVTLLFAGGIASADLSKGVIGAFHGQLVVSKAELSEGKTDKDTIAKIKSEKLSELVGTANEDVTSWTFHYTAFLTKPGASTLKMEFYRDGKQYAADKRLDGIDPKSAVLSGDISISEDEGLAKGKTYVIKLTSDKNVVVAQTTIVMK